MKWLPFAIAALFAGGAFAIDFDGDGWVLGEEVRYGGGFLDGDRDDDGLSDGWEGKHGINPRLSDTDRDGLPDGTEVAIGANPTNFDTDNDGRPDGSEDVEDCDGDGSGGLLDSDNDDDKLGDKADGAPCNPDQDSDSILDGREQNRACITLADCDFDGLLDGDEIGGFEALKADSFGIGIPDGVTFVFAEAGQEASADLDQDAIPDAWENGDGLISWGPFSPRAGTPDILVEFLRVTGPDSGTYALDFSPSYNQVESLFAARNIDFQWIETSVPLASEPFLSFLEPADQAEFLEILAKGAMSDNPYVTTIIMNPQQVQENFGEILGAAHLRSMLAVIDYGTHVEIDLEGISTTATFSPTVESHIRTNNRDYLTAIGADDFGIENGEYWFSVNGPDGYIARWEPHWFSQGMSIQFNGGKSDTVLPVATTIDYGSLASTLAHEVGHTLGLCHAHVQSCFQNFTSSDIPLRDQSTMSYNAPSNTMRFLDSEWSAVRTFLTCPPETPLTLLANGASTADILQDKYRFSGDVLRLCGEFVSREIDMEPEDGYTVAAFPSPSKEPRGGTIWFALYILAGATATVASVVLGRSTLGSGRS